MSTIAQKLLRSRDNLLISENLRVQRVGDEANPLLRVVEQSLKDYSSVLGRVVIKRLAGALSRQPLHMFSILFHSGSLLAVALILDSRRGKAKARKRAIPVPKSC
jgi:hypothetical protein